MYKIKHIKKSGTSKYEIEFLDNSKIKIYDNVLLKNNILFKKELSSELYNKLLEENAKEDIYYQTVKFISRKMRSRKEVEEFLNKSDIEYNEKQEILDRLDSLRLIDDKAYARAYLQDSFLLSSAGPNKIKKELLYNNIDSDYIDVLLQEIDIQDIYNKLEKIIIKKVKANSTKSNYALRQKIIFDVSNLGYDSSMINEVLDSIDINSNNSIINKEYNKLYRKLSNKYKDEELQRQIYYKLRCKGFNDSEINNIDK